MIDYKFNEGELIDEFKKYVDFTYSGHYSKDRNFQAAEFIFDSGHGIGFTLGNVMKYAQRYGHKGTVADQRKDLMKIIHYAFMALYEHDKQNGIEKKYPVETKYSQGYTTEKEKYVDFDDDDVYRKELKSRGFLKI